LIELNFVENNYPVIGRLQQREN